MDKQEWYELFGWLLLAVALTAIIHPKQEEQWTKQNDTLRCLRPMYTEPVPHCIQSQLYTTSADGTGVMLPYIPHSLHTTRLPPTDTTSTLNQNNKP